MYPVELYLKDFLSFEEETYTFERGKPILIQGRNLYREGQESNGSGKSVLQAAIEYCYMKTTSRKVVDSKLVRRGDFKEATVKCKTFCPIRNQTLIIKRTIPVKGSSQCDIWLDKEGDDNKVTDLATVKDVDDYIMNWLAFEVKTDIQNFYIMNKEKYKSFFTASNTEKLALIGRLYDFSSINEAIEEVDKKDKEFNDKISPKNDSVLKIEGKIEENEETLESLKEDDFEKNKKERVQVKKDKIKEVESEIEDIDEKLKQNKSALKKNQNKIIEVNKSISKTKSSLETINKKYEKEISKIEKEIESYKKTKEETLDLEEEFNEELEKVNIQLSSIKKNLMDSVICPNCDFNFIPGNTEVDLKKEESKKKECEKSIDEIKESIKECKEIYQTISDNVKSEKNKKTLKEINIEEESKDIKSNLKELNSDIDELELLISSQERKIKSLNSEKKEKEEEVIKLSTSIKEIKAEEKDDKLSISLKEKIKEQKKELKTLNKEIEELNQQKASNLEWKVNFQRFKMHLSNKVLLLLQSKINQCIKAMGSELRVKMEGFKLLASGELKEKITPYIIDNGELCDYHSFSGGERARIDYSVIAAIQDLINNSHPYGGLDLLWADEIMESMDSAGIRNCLKSLEYLNKTVLITTHVAIKDLYDNNIIIENKYGISRIVKK